MVDEATRMVAPGKRAKRAWLYLSVASVLLSVGAAAMVVGNVAAGVPPQPDENAWAHLFQLAMAAQAPLIVLFLVTADWTRKGRVIVLLVAQPLAVASAFTALAWSGY